MRDVAIVGAGIIGLSIGWQLAKSGLKVLIVDGKQAGRQASWAAAGMLAPYCETLFFNNELPGIGEKSLGLYPQFLQDLAVDSECDLPEEATGTLCVAINRDDREWLEHQYAFRAKHGMPAHRLTGDEARRMDPLLSPRVNSGIWIPTEKQVNSRLVVQALIQAFKNKGGELVEEVDISNSVEENGKTVGIKTTDGRHIPAKTVVISAGAWSGTIATPHRDTVEGIRPIKGQTILLHMPTTLRLKMMVRSPRVYLAPKAEGILHVGASSDDHGFDGAVMAGTVLELLQDAREVLPAIAEYNFVEALSGFRPITTTHAPIVGRTQLHGLYYATGHGRSGILLAPYTAHHIKNLILEDRFYED